MATEKVFAAIDLGASGGRVAAGRFDGETLRLEMTHRFPNASVEAGGHWYWGALGLFQGVKDGLARLTRAHGRGLAGLAVDTWGVDFALLDSQGKLVANPYCARDPQTRGLYPEIFRRIPQSTLFARTGIQFMELNSLVQLYAMQRAGDPAYASAAHFLMIPDLLNYWLTGRMCCEYTNATTSQLLDVATRGWSDPVLSALGFPRRLFPELVHPGQILGGLRAAVLAETGLSPDTPVLATASHDTAAAVVAVPAAGENFGYISSGTWALLGRELSAPLLDERVPVYNFGNEGGAFGRITFLKNLSNMWFMQELRREWAARGHDYSWDDLTCLAAGADPFTAWIDPDSPLFVVPGDMSGRIRRACRESGQPVPQQPGQILRVVLESLAFKYRFTNDRFSALTGRPVDVMHVVGGGSQNELLNQLTANGLGVPVIAGPVEATTIGNLVVQMAGLGLLASLEEGRELVRRSFPTRLYEPCDSQVWQERYADFLRVTRLAA